MVQKKNKKKIIIIMSKECAKLCVLRGEGVGAGNLEFLLPAHINPAPFLPSPASLCFDDCKKFSNNVV